MSDQRNKRIFISDLHMGDDRSLNPGGDLYPYVWIAPPRTQMCADFLATLVDRPDVSDLVILGDLLDQWICPTEFDPTHFKKVAAAEQNKDIITNLNKIADHNDITVSYVRGKTDMLLAKEELKKIIPGADFLGEKPGEGVFEADGIAAEHGNMYSMFNSPDTWSFPSGSLPLGFFISRMVTHKEAVIDEKQSFLEMIALLIKDQEKSPQLARDVFEAIALDCSLPPKEKIHMNKLDHNPDVLTVDQVAFRYATLFKTWGENTPTGFTSLDGVLSDMEGLAPSAWKAYFKENKADIAIMGHTHKWVLDGYVLSKCFPRNPFKHIPCTHIYANSGTWVNGKPLCTYVETELDQDKGRHYVRVFQYTDSGEKKLLKEHFVKIK